MKYFFFFIILLALDTGCKPRILSGTELDNKLMETMKVFLDTTLKPGVKVKVIDVTYYPEKWEKTFHCEFKVNMHFANYDTTGVMAATISNDFNKVVRTQ